VLHHHPDLAAQVLLVKLERLGTVSAVVQISIQSHGFDTPGTITRPPKAQSLATPAFNHAKSEYKFILR
jgi:hypothetical protein